MEENHTNIVTDDTQEFYKFVLFAWTPLVQSNRGNLGFLVTVYTLYML